MYACFVDFFILVQCCPFRLKNNVEFLKGTQGTHTCHWVERPSPVYNFPVYVIINILSFKTPDVKTEGGFLAVSHMSEGLGVVPVSFFKFS